MNRQLSFAFTPDGETSKMVAANRCKPSGFAPVKLVFCPFGFHLNQTFALSGLAVGIHRKLDTSWIMRRHAITGCPCFSVPSPCLIRAMAHLVRALPPKASLLLVGDIDQIPSDPAMQVRACGHTGSKD